MARDGTLNLELAGEAVLLDPRRAMVWPKRKTLIIADPHIGKGDTFRRAGIPVPARAAEADFDRLSAMIDDYRPDRLVVLGDFLHARLHDADDCLNLLADWRARFSALEVVIVRGNHDAHAGPPPTELGLTSVDQPHADGPFAYRHFPLGPQTTDEGSCATGFALAGHLHPGVTVSLGGRSARRVPCFWVTPQQAVFPAFGGFTGTWRVAPDRTGRVYAVGRDRVIALPRPAVV